MAAIAASMLAGCSGSGENTVSGTDLNASAMAKKSPRGKGKLDPNTATGTITLTWAPPTVNTDGSAPSDLSGYRVRYGTSSGSLVESADVAGATTTSLVVPGLQRGATYYFTMSAVNASGVASNATNLVSAVAQ